MSSRHKTHYFYFVAARSQQGLDSLNTSLEWRFRTKALGRAVPGCNQRTGKLSRRKVEWWQPEPRHVQERIGELGLAGGMVPCTSYMKDAVKNLTDAEEKPRKVEFKEFFQSLTSNRMFFQSMDDSTIQFEMVMVITDMCKPTFGAMARLMRVGRFKPDKRSLKPRLFADAGSVSDDSARESFVIGRSRDPCVGRCAAESFVMNCWNGMQLKHMTFTGRPDIDSDSPTARGAAKRSERRRGKHMEVSTKYLSATTWTLLARMPLYFGERLGLV